MPDEEQNSEPQIETNVVEERTETTVTEPAPEFDESERPRVGPEGVKAAQEIVDEQHARMEEQAENSVD